MNLFIVNQTPVPVPRKYLKTALTHLVEQPFFNRFKRNKNKNLVLAFLQTNQARHLNLEFRGKDYATDVLSFSPTEDDDLGELVFCPDVLKKQSLEHGLSYRDELIYMVYHGVLHLLGYEHETNEKDAKKMFAIQDRAFASFLQRPKI